MGTAMLALAFGLLALRTLPALPPSTWLWPMLVVGLVLGVGRGFRLGLFLLGLCWACLHAQWALDDRLAPELDERTLWIEGTVVGLPAYNGRSVRFEVAQPRSRRATLPSRLRLAWHRGPALVSGERWRLAVTLRRPRGLVNPGGFDAQAWALGKGFGATGSVKAGERLSEAAMSWRQALRERLLAVDAQGQQATLVALVLGDGSGVTRKQWEVLQATGTVHLLVISGQHIGMLAGLIYGLVAGSARVGWWPARWPWLPCACALALGAALAYGWLAGFQVPVRRACIMIALVLLWRLRFRHLGVWTPLLTAFTLVLLVNPLASLLPGFWLSFVAVGVLLASFSGRLGGWRWWHAWTRAQWCVGLGLMPAMVALALPVSLSGPLVNLLAVPWISLLVLPLTLLGTVLLAVPVLGETLLWLSGGLLAVLFEGMAGVVQATSPWLPPGLSVAAWVLLTTGTVVVLLPAAIPLRPLGLPLLGLALFAPRQAPEAGYADIWQFDVGQGLAVLVRTANHQLIYDAGPAMGETDAGASVVVPSLLALGVRRLDLLVISHAHLDHFGGAATLRSRLPVTRVISGEPGALPGPWGAQNCESGHSWEWDRVKFTLWRWAAASHSNAASCVLMIEANGERLLLSGDIDAAAERALLDSEFDARARWLQSPHHGSRTSSSKPFLQAVEPESVLISRGHGNTFGHPHGQVMTRYRELGIHVHDNAVEGALRIHLGAWEAVGAQREQRRFWREPLQVP